MILLADGGSSKTDWRVINRGNDVVQVFTTGINPFFRTYKEISNEIKYLLLPEIGAYINSINSIYFYGAGCTDNEKSKIIYDAIAATINEKHIEVDSDLLGAARGLCGHNAGIACILGTGSNSCYYDGTNIVQHISPLGYILGDEGSGAVLGRLFIGACLKNQLGEELKKEFLAEYDLTPALILENVYKKPMPNRFLASFSPFILKHLDNEKVYNLVYNAFEGFFIKNVMQYDYKNTPIHFTGSIAFYYKDILLKAGNDMNLHIGKIERSPMDGLIRYYSNAE